MSSTEIHIQPEELPEELAVTIAQPHDDHQGFYTVPAGAHQVNFPDEAYDKILKDDSINPPTILSRKINTKYKWQKRRIPLHKIDRKSFTDQDARAGRNEEDHNIYRAMGDVGINLEQAMPILRYDRITKKYYCLGGHGRLNGMHKHNVIEAPCWVTYEAISLEDQTSIALGSNDHLPASAISSVDVEYAAKRVFENGGITGISKDLAKRYKTTIDPSVEHEVNDKLSRWVAKVAGQTLSETKRANIVSNLSKSLRNAEVVDVYSAPGGQAVLDLMDEESKRTSSYPVNIGNAINITVASVTEGTRKAEAMLAQIITSWKKQRQENQKNGITEEINTINVVTCPSKIDSKNFGTKMTTVFKAYVLKAKFEEYTHSLTDFLGLELNGFIDGKIPKIRMLGFINPMRQLEKYGWAYKSLITYPDIGDPINSLSFDDILDAAKNDGMFAGDDKTYNKLKKAYREEFGMAR